MKKNILFTIIMLFFVVIIYAKTIDTSNGKYVIDGANWLTQLYCYSHDSCAVLPDGIIGIRKQVFHGYKDYIEEIVLPESLKYIDKEAFGNSRHSSISDNKIYNSNKVILNKIIIPKNVESIGDRAFLNCDNLTNIYIPKNVKYLGNGIFIGCSNLSVYLDTENNNFFYENGILWDKAKNRIIFSNKSITNIDLSKEKIKYIFQDINEHNRVFGYSKNDIDLTIYKNYNYGINAYTFENCKNLKTINLPNNIEAIDEGAFKNCVELEQIKLPNTIKMIGPYAFANCSKLETINLPSSLEVIESGAFNNCKNLKNIILPQNLKCFSVDAFNNCDSLKEITIPNSVEFISAMSEPTIKINFLPDNKKFYIDGNKLCFKEETIDIPNGTTEILYRQFENNKHIKNLILPETIKKIDNCAFEKCFNLKNVVFNNGLKEIGVWSFQHCNSLESITLPASLEKLSSGAFRYCENLQKVEILNGLRIIDEQVFMGCKNIKEIIIPDSVTQIGNWAFNGCESLEKISLPENIEKIELNIFMECNSLKKIIIPKSVKELEYHDDGVFPYIRDKAFKDTTIMITNELWDSLDKSKQEKFKKFKIYLYN